MKIHCEISNFERTNTLLTQCGLPTNKVYTLYIKAFVKYYMYQDAMIIHPNKENTVIFSPDYCKRCLNSKEVKLELLSQL